jgi:hypothetical protein
MMRRIAGTQAELPELACSIYPIVILHFQVAISETFKPYCSLECM